MNVFFRWISETHNEKPEWNKFLRLARVALFLGIVKDILKDIPNRPHSSEENVMTRICIEKGVDRDLNQKFFQFNYINLTTYQISRLLVKQSCKQPFNKIFKQMNIKTIYKFQAKTQILLNCWYFDPSHYFFSNNKKPNIPNGCFLRNHKVIILYWTNSLAMVCPTFLRYNKRYHYGSLNICSIITTNFFSLVISLNSSRYWDRTFPWI